MRFKNFVRKKPTQHLYIEKNKVITDIKPDSIMTITTISVSLVGAILTHTHN